MIIRGYSGDPELDRLLARVERRTPSPETAAENEERMIRDIQEQDTRIKVNLEQQRRTTSPPPATDTQSPREPSTQLPSLPGLPAQTDDTTDLLLPPPPADTTGGKVGLGLVLAGGALLYLLLRKK